MTCPWCMTPVICGVDGCQDPPDPPPPWWRRLLHFHIWHQTDCGMFGDGKTCRCGASTYDHNLPWMTLPRWVSRRMGYIE